ncbi:MAG: tetratricopeptide repeat protein [Hyphomonadaceae bacterium]
MADVLIAAGPDDAAHAQGLAEALALLGFDAKPAALDDAGAGAAIGEAKCVLTVWSRTPPASLVAASALALERRKLVSAELARNATPEPLRAAPHVALNARERTAFKARFEALVSELDKFAPTPAAAQAMPQAVTRARAALLAQPAARRPMWQTALGLTAAVAVLFAIGFGAGRIISAMRSGHVLVAAAPAEASASDAAGESPALSWAQLETAPWRDTAARLATEPNLLSRARGGDARAQALACLAHLAGVEGFLPSPTAALNFCNASAAQHEPAGLYFSWVLYKTAPHAGLDDATARDRLAEAARLGWSAAQIDYGAELAPDARASRDAQAEAGRLWLAAAEGGDPRGQFFYARWLRDSPAGPRDPRQALPYLERAAEAGYAEALHMLATFYRDGIGAPRDSARARALYQRAADQNYAPSMFNLADMLRNGDEGERSRAIVLYRQLACLRDERQIRADGAAAAAGAGRKRELRMNRQQKRHLRPGPTSLVRPYRRERQPRSDIRLRW